jgi:hypothetical protein
LEGIGDGKIRCSASAWSEGKTILKGEVLEVRAAKNGSKQLWVLRRARENDPVEDKFPGAQPRGFSPDCRQRIGAPQHRSPGCNE